MFQRWYDDELLEAARRYHLYYSNNKATTYARHLATGVLLVEPNVLRAPCSPGFSLRACSVVCVLLRLLIARVLYSP